MNKFSLLIVCLLMSVTLNVAKAETTPLTTPASATAFAALLKSDEGLAATVKQRFDQYVQAYEHQMLYACTQRVADYNGVQLSNAFYPQAKRVSHHTVKMRKLLNASLTKAKYRFPSASKNIDEFLKSNIKHPVISAKTVTRGFCQNYQKTFTAKIVKNLARYRVTPVENGVESATKKDALYLNARFQVVSLTAQLPHSLSTNVSSKKTAHPSTSVSTTPNTLVMGDKSYALQCHYEDVQRYERAIAVNDHSLKGIVYQATQHFYHKVSPQINAILACQTQANLSDRKIIRVVDTYPWFQPLVVGSNGKKAAGDAMTYVDKNHLVVVLGHEPCVCNWQSQDACQRLKTVSRENKQHTWGLLVSLEKEKSGHNPKVQQAITHYTQWGQQELKKDFCFIDRAAILDRLGRMLKQIKTAELKPRTLYFNDKLHLLNVNIKLAQHQTPLFYDLGDGKASHPIQCTYEEVKAIEHRIIGNQSIPAAKQRLFNVSQRFYNKISPSIDYILTCRGNFPTKSARSIENDTASWYRGPYSKHVGTYAEGRSLSYITPHQLILVVGHRPCLCTAATEEKCQQFMEIVRKQKQAHLKLRNQLVDFSHAKYASEQSKKLIADYFRLEQQNEKIEPCDRQPKVTLDKLTQIKVTMKQDLTSRKWWWPF